MKTSTKKKVQSLAVGAAACLFASQLLIMSACTGGVTF